MTITVSRILQPAVTIVARPYAVAPRISRHALSVNRDAHAVNVARAAHAVKVGIPAAAFVPGNAWLAADGTPIRAEDGSYILTY